MLLFPKNIFVPKYLKACFKKDICVNSQCKMAVIKQGYKIGVIKRGYKIGVVKRGYKIRVVKRGY